MKGTVTIGKISLKLRAEVLHLARGSCQMCGRTIARHKVALVVVDIMPEEQRVTDHPDNFWAICEDCNHRGASHFFSHDPATLRWIVGHKSVHIRIGELLKRNLGKAVPGKLIKFVANQAEWKKRTRELRYLGWHVEASRDSDSSGHVTSAYTLHTFIEWPSDPTRCIRKYEKDRGRRCKADASIKMTDRPPTLNC